MVRGNKFKPGEPLQKRRKIIDAAQDSKTEVSHLRETFLKCTVTPVLGISINNVDPDSMQSG